MDYKLWEGTPPHFDPSYGQDVPTITPYLCEGGEKRGAVIICPGGAYVGRAEHEGRPIAKMINEAGVHAFVLNYRVTPYHHPVELEDALRAIKYVRYHSPMFNVDPYKIAIMGFSAGGHLALSAIEHFDSGKTGPGCDVIDAVTSRPDGGILCYAVCSMLEFGHAHTRLSLLGENPDPELCRELSGECSVRDNTPPVFLWHTMQDWDVNPRGSLDLCIALHKKGIPLEAHFFPEGPHGIGLAEAYPHSAQWTELLKKWLIHNGY